MTLRRPHRQRTPSTHEEKRPKDSLKIGQILWNWVWGRGCDEAEITEEKRLFTRHSVNEDFGKELYRKGDSVKRFWPFSESPDSENWLLLRSSPSQISAPNPGSSAQIPVPTPLQKCQFFSPLPRLNFVNFWLEGILKRYPEIGDCPKKVPSNPPKGSIEPFRTSKGSIEPPFGPRKVFERLPVKGFSEPQKRFYRTFRIETPLFRLPFSNFPYWRSQGGPYLWKRLSGSGMPQR